MDLVNPRDMLVEARRGGYAVGAFNIHNLETLQAVVEAASEATAQVILQATPGTVKYVGADYLVAMARVAARQSGVPIALHLDHSIDIELIGACLEAGFTSVMFDGSALPLEENIARTRQVAAMAHAKGAAVEAELGRLGGREDDLTVDETAANYTDPGEAATFAAATGIDSLAVAIGTAHGVYRGEPHIDFERLQEIAASVNLPLVLHGASGLPDAVVTRCIELGISKVNIATDLKLVLVARLRETLASNPEETDPRHYFIPAREAVKKVALAKIRLFGTAGRIQ